MAATWPEKMGGKKKKKKGKRKRALQTCAELNENMEEIQRNRAIFYWEQTHLCFLISACAII